MIRLHSIEAVNFRSLGEVMFEPLVDDRLTAIVGTNGAGKSSVVTALVWALYGVTPDGVNVKDLRRQGTSSADECRVSVTFEHDGQTIVVTRQLKGNKDTTVAGITVDGSETTASSVRAANEWLTNRIGLDADGFLAAVLVQQKQVDALVTSPPRERRDLVERLARIDKMGEAAQAARKTALDAQRVLEALPGSDEDVTSAQAQHEAAEDAANEAQMALDMAESVEATAKAEFEAVKTVATEIAVALEQRKQAETTRVEAENSLNLLKAKEPALLADVDRLTVSAGDASEAKVAEAEAAQQAADEEVERLREAASAATNADWALKAASTALETAKSELDAAAVAAERIRGTFVSAEETLEQAKSAVNGFRSDLDSTVTETQQQVDTLTEDVGAARGEHDRLTTAIAALAGTHDPSCPTCAQPIHDLDTLIVGLEKDREGVKARGTSLRAELNTAQEQLNTLREHVSSRTAAESRLERAQRDVDTARESVLEAERTETTKSKVVREKQAEFAEAEKVAKSAAKMAEAAREALPAAQQRAQTASAAVHAARSALTAANDLIEASERLAQLQEQIVTAMTALDEATAVVNGIEVPAEDEQSRVRQEWTDKQTAAATATAVVGEKRGLVIAAKGALTQAQERLGLATQQKAARTAAVVDYQRKVATRDALEAFRKDRLNRLAPELAEVASDLVNRMSNGKYVAVHLDEDFTPTVTDEDGFERPVAWLSGGEESLVALALRIAIGDVVFGADGGLLFLDEVLSAMDDVRRDSTISAVRELPGRQIIMINHIPEAADVGDLVLRVVPSPEGSILEPVDKDGENVHLDALDADEDYM